MDGMETFILGEVMVGFVGWYVIEEMARYSGLLLVFKGSMHLSYVQDIMSVFSHDNFTSTGYQLPRLEM